MQLGDVKSPLAQLTPYLITLHEIKTGLDFADFAFAKAGRAVDSSWHSPRIRSGDGQRIDPI